jgi:gliding motility-associated-like protein
LEGSVTLCTPKSVDLLLNANGYQGVFSIEYSVNGVKQPLLNNLKDKDLIKVNPSLSTIYKIEKVILPSKECNATIGTDAKIDIGNIDVKAKSSSNYAGYSVKCSGGNEGQATVETNSGKAPFTFLWENGEKTKEISGLKAGRYKVTVTDVNGCLAVSEAEITEPKPISFQLSMKPPSCNDAKSASITIDNIVGGAGFLTYIYNNSIPSTVKKPTTITGIEGGDYEVQIKDENACFSNAKISIPTTKLATLSLGDDQFLNLGDSIKLEPILNFSANKITWKNTKYLSCSNCLQPTSKPFNTILYTLTVADSLGCQATDEVTIYVDKKRPIFIPNSFSPNDDSFNDLLVVFADLKVILEIKSFRIFDRWGNVVFEKLSFKPNDPAFGWDGTYKNSPMNPAVFTYSCEVEFVDNQVLVYRGDVDLVR